MNYSNTSVCVWFFAHCILYLIAAGISDLSDASSGIVRASEFLSGVVMHPRVPGTQPTIKKR
jgi:hypothetical protein